MIDTIKKISFNGKIKNDKEEEWPALVYLEYDEYDPRILQCRLTLENIPTFSEWPGVLEDQQSNPRIIGESLERRNILIKYTDFSGQSIFPAKRGEADLNISTFNLGFSGEIPFTTGNYTFLITILDAPSVRVFAGRESGYLGDIKSGRKPDDGISLKSDLGDILIGNYFELKKAQIGIEKAQVQIERAQLIISGDFNQKIIVEESIDHIEHEIKDILTLLSFINRRSVQWYEIKLTYYESAEARRTVSLIKRKKIWSIKGSAADRLFDQLELRKGLLARLVESYRNSLMKITIERSITFLIASYERDTLESQLQAAYSATEAIANSLSKKKKVYHLPKRKANKKRKINPISKRILDLIKIYKIDCWDFGDPEKIDLGSMIGDIFDRRNDMMHEGKTYSADLLYSDAVRLRAMCERLILAELGFNDNDAFYCNAYAELRFLGVQP